MSFYLNASEMKSVDVYWIADVRVAPKIGSIYEVQPLTRLSNQTLEGQIRGTTALALQDFGLLAAPPDLRFIADKKDPLFAAVDGRIEDGSRDQVLLFGEAFTSVVLDCLGGKVSGASLSGVIGHEVAHLFQFRNGWWSELLNEERQAVRRAELHADLLAGWFLARRSFIDLIGIDEASRCMFEIGDFEFTSIDHHGTPAQRYAALLMGFFMGRDTSLTLETVAKKGAEFVRGIAPREGGK